LWNGVGHIPQQYQVEWFRAGLLENTPQYADHLFDVIDFGADPEDNGNDDYPAIHQAILAARDSFGLSIIYFPPGTYNIQSPIELTYLDSNIVFQGAGSEQSTLKFNISETSQCFNIHGYQTDTLIFLDSDIPKDSRDLYGSGLDALQPGDWIRLSEYNFDLYNDNDKPSPNNWAQGSVGQITRIESVSASHAVMKDKASKGYSDNNDLRVWKIVPIKNVGIEKLKIIRMNSGDSDSGSNILFKYAVNCWVKGIESYKTSRHHIDIQYSSHIYISGCYFHEANNYGGGGRGYGIVLNFSTTNCLIENNIFQKLRHAMLVQAGANCNVFTYNYSRDQYGTDTYSDLTLHGNLPYSNLFEHNFVEFIHADATHGNNGPFNTFFRNKVKKENDAYNNYMRVENMSFVGVISCELSDHYISGIKSGMFGGIVYYATIIFSKEFYGFISGVELSHPDVEEQNNRNQCYNDDISYYYSTRPEFLSNAYTFPTIGAKSSKNSSLTSQNIPARDRYNSNIKTYISNPTIPPVFVIIDQKNSGNQSFGFVELWNNDWIAYPVPDTFQWRVGIHKILRADTNSNNSEKFHDWNGNEFLNHNNFEINQDLTNIVARHYPISEARIESYLLSSNIYNYGSIEFSDPWLRDYIETPYGKKNQGKGAPLKSYSLPLKLTTQPPFRGVFLNQPYTGSKPYYSVRAPQQLMPFRDDLVPANLDHWEGDPDSVTFQYPNQTETAVVFKKDCAVSRAVYKSPLVVSNASAIAHNNQRKHFYDGSTYHLVYEEQGIFIIPIPPITGNYGVKKN